MKKKFSRILGVALPLAMVIALAVMLLPAASTPTTEAAEGTLRFGAMSLPRYVEDGGRYVLVHDQDVGPIAVAPAGNVLFTACDVTDPGAVNSLLKSADDGHSWTLQAAFRTTATGIADNTSIVKIAVSPEYATDGTLFVATDNLVYQSVDGGSEFTAMSREWAVAELITDFDVTLDSGGRLSIIVGTATAGNAGDVYVYSPATTGMTWQVQRVDGSAAAGATTTRKVLAVAFSPNFANDEGISAVTMDGATTEIRFAFGATKTGGGWAGSIGDGTFRDTINGNADVTATQARIAFPDDFDDASISSNIAFVGLMDDPASALTGGSDVYKVTFQPTMSTTLDLNVRGRVGIVQTGTNIWSMDITGDAEAATILVGTDNWSTGVANYYWTAYISTDSGATWTSAREKSPTGGTGTWSPAFSLGVTMSSVLVSGTDANCYVALSPDFATSGVAYAGTSDVGTDTSAFSRTTDGGASWNQISLIDYSTNALGYTVIGYSVQSDWATSKTAIMLTASVAYIGAYTMDGGAVWKTTDGGAHYDRIWSYANPTATRVIQSAGRAYAEANIGETIYAFDYTNGKMWRSTDYGATFPRLVRDKLGGGIAAAFVVTPDMIWIAYANNQVWTTTSLGRPWVEPEESIIAGIPIFYALAAGSLYLVPNAAGTFYVSQDSGVTFTKTLGVTDPGVLGAPVWGTPDANYAENKYFYASVMAAGGGIWRIVVNEEDPESTEWIRIDETSDNYTGFAPGLIEQKAGVTYVYCGTPVDTARSVGGFWRSLNPEADINGANPPVFTIENTGLAVGDNVSYKSTASNPTTIFFKNNRYDVDVGGGLTMPLGNYMNQVVAFKDVLSEVPAMVAPKDGAADVGVRLNTTDLRLTATLSWEAVSGAQSYELELAYDEAFSSEILLPDTEGLGNGVTAGQQWTFTNELLPGTTYYWRVRASQPVISPWSAGRSFSTADITIEQISVPTAVVEFDVVSPGRGDSGVPVQPVFVWTEVEGAESYELVVAEDKTFAIIEWSHTADTSFYQGDEVLAYGTTYYWRVRAAGGEWANGVFTTVQKAVAEEPAVVIEKEPAPPAEIVQVEVPGAAAAIPNYLLWTIIGVGAVLVIALIVLIVRTRRVT